MDRIRNESVYRRRS